MPTTLVGLKAHDPLDKVVHTRVFLEKNICSLALKYNQHRRLLNLSNDSDAVMYITFGVLSTLNFGIRLNPGESMKCTSVDSSLCNLEVYAIQGKGANKLLLVTEGE